MKTTTIPSILLLASCVSPSPPPVDRKSDWTAERLEKAVAQVRAGRDLTPKGWPNGAKVAVLSFDVDNLVGGGAHDLRLVTR